MSRLDKGNALLVGAREDLLTRLQVVQNTAARMALQKPYRHPSLPLLNALHWLPVKKRAVFKLLTLTFKAWEWPFISKGQDISLSMRVATEV